MAERMDFGMFYMDWMEKLQAFMIELRNPSPEASRLEDLRRQVENMYDSYFSEMQQAARRDVLKMLSPNWKTPLELADMWIGDWRPSLFFRLFYGLKKYYSRLQSEPRSGTRAPPHTGLAVVTDTSLQAIRQLEEKISSEEKRLSECMRSIQLSPAKEPFLSYLDVEMHNAGWMRDAVDAFDDAIVPCIAELESIYLDAIVQRKDALMGILGALDTLQSLEYLKGLSQFLISVRDTDLLLALQKDDKEPLEFW